LIRGPCKPPPGFMSPIRTLIVGFPRWCQHEWFTKYDRLEYTEKDDRWFCLHCYLFRDCNKGQGGMNGAFVILGNHIRDEFLNDCIICFIEEGFLATIPINDVIVHFHMMEGHSNRGTLQEVTTVVICKNYFVTI
jgi:hypothetical protein